VFRVHAPKYNNATRRPFPKREFLKNNLQKVTNFSAPNTTIKSPQITTIPPQFTIKKPHQTAHFRQNPLQNAKYPPK
jgi:hypothetical protein